LFLHFVLDNYEFLDYVVKSANRYLSKHDRDYQIEQTCIKYIKKLAKTPSNVNRLELFEKMDSEISELLKDYNERVILEYFDVEAWIRSKLKKISFTDAVTELTNER